jgi:hypothetical protein
VRKDSSKDKNEPKKKKKYKKPAMAKHGKLGRLVVARSIA